MNIPADLRYSAKHEWVRLAGQEATIGITDYAQKELTDIVFVELPEVGRECAADEALAVLESVKAVSDAYAPVAGTVVAVNGELADKPELVNQDPYGAGWMVKLELADPGQVEGLLTAAQYQELITG